MCCGIPAVQSSENGFLGTPFFFKIEQNLGQPGDGLFGLSGLGLLDVRFLGRHLSQIQLIENARRRSAFRGSPS